MLPDIPSVEKTRSEFDRILGSRATIKRDRAAVKAEIKRLEHEEEVLQLTSRLFIALTDTLVKDGTAYLEALLTEGLGQVFLDQQLSVKTAVDVKRNKVYLKMLTEHRRGGIRTVGDPEESFGGALATLQSLLLRVLVILKKRLRRVVFLDESLNALSVDYARNMGIFLRQLCEKLGLDVLVVTQDRTLFELGAQMYEARVTSDGARIVRV